jgi:hypothetical protein
VLVAEAPAKSGALITASFALKQGRDVFAIPGSIISNKSAGTHLRWRSAMGRRFRGICSAVYPARCLNTRAVMLAQVWLSWRSRPRYGWFLTA